MELATYMTTENAAIPAIVRLGKYETPVWIQSAWETGEFAFYIRRNGCGHCCAAMAANLNGVKITPYEEYLLCRELWGAPDENIGQDHFQTVAGITKVLSHLGIPAQFYTVEEGKQQCSAAHIVSCLKEGKTVIFACDPFRNPGDPFSTGYHYVLAVGFLQEGEILVANSSEDTVKGGVQFVTEETIAKSLYRGSTASPDMTWGQVEYLDKCCTYVVVG